MPAHASGTFKIESWDEQRYGELDDGGGLARASVVQAFSGDIEGEGSVEWLFCYRPDKTADFVGLQRVAGQIGARHGSVVLRTAGTFDGAEAKGEWTVVRGSGTGELRGLRGQGGFRAPIGSEAAIALDYDFE
jgi:Protein of unknown function (DUF3224)